MNNREHSPLLNYESSSVSVKVDVMSEATPNVGRLSDNLPGSGTMAPIPGASYNHNRSIDPMPARLMDEIQSEASVDN